MRTPPSHTGQAVSIQDNGRLMANIDTDMIIPKQFLKTLTRKGLGKGLFHELRTRSDGRPDPDFVLNRPKHAGASILIAGENFGCGSSREHAPWALLDYGIKCVIAPSFADIFYMNCLKNGLLPIVLAAKTCEELAAQTGGNNCLFTIDLPEQSVRAPDGKSCVFEIEAGIKDNLIQGHDEIDRTLSLAAEIEKFERKQTAHSPWSGR